MAFEIVGKLYKKFDAETKGATFNVREFVIEIMDGQYAQFIKFQLVQDRTALLDNYQEGESIKVHFDLRGREWQGKFFTSLNCWRLEKGDAEAPATSAKPIASAKPVSATSSDSSFPSEPPVQQNTVEDDLPF